MKLRSLASQLACVSGATFLAGCSSPADTTADNGLQGGAGSSSTTGVGGGGTGGGNPGTGGSAGSPISSEGGAPSPEGGTVANMLPHGKSTGCGMPPPAGDSSTKFVLHEIDVPGVGAAYLPGA